MSHNFEAIKEIYKKKLSLFRLIEPNQNLRDFQMQIELILMFDLSKTKYLQILCDTVDFQLLKYM